MMMRHSVDAQAIVSTMYEINLSEQAAKPAQNNRLEQSIRKSLILVKAAPCSGF
jgi:hypothetical protein